jgi:hypothetical protein
METPEYPKPMTYLLTVQCARPEIGMMAEYHASTPFPSLRKGDFLELIDCEPKIWDVIDVTHRLVKAADGSVICGTWVLADSPVVENTGYVVKKQSGEEVGPSSTRFGRIRDGADG